MDSLHRYFYNYCRPRAPYEISLACGAVEFRLDSCPGVIFNSKIVVTGVVELNIFDDLYSLIYSVEIICYRPGPLSLGS